MTEWRLLADPPPHAEEVLVSGHYSSGEEIVIIAYRYESGEWYEVQHDTPLDHFSATWTHWATLPKRNGP